MNLFLIFDVYLCKNAVNDRYLDIVIYRYISISINYKCRDSIEKNCCCALAVEYRIHSLKV